MNTQIKFYVYLDSQKDRAIFYMDSVADVIRACQFHGITALAIEQARD
jgi:hypothetical protein